MVQLVGATRCLWASDFPHYEASMDPLREFEEQGAFTDTERQRILYDSALGFYGFESGDLPTAPRSQPEGARSRADNPD